jgi:hypothetical protein
MSVYPSSIPYINPEGMNIRFKTLVSSFDEEGEENRKQKWLYPKRDVTLKYQSLSKDDAEVIWEFYLARKGSYNSFSWFESTGLGTYRTYSSEYVATGDSTTLTFVLPAKESSGATHDVNLNGSAASTSDYTMSFGGGGDGEDKVTFIGSSTGGLGPPGSTAQITYDFEGRLKIRCRFAEDVFSFENFYDRLVNSGVKLKGLLNL